MANGDALFMFCKNVGVCDFNEADIVAILAALKCF